MRVHGIRRRRGRNFRTLILIFFAVFFSVFSAGVGRTGTLITIDAEMQRAEHERELNPYQFVRQMRENRNHMVQTEVLLIDCY